MAKPFLTTGQRMRRCLSLPGVHPGDFQRTLGATAGVPIRAKTWANLLATRPGDRSVAGFCQGSGQSAVLADPGSTQVKSMDDPVGRNPDR